MANSWAKLWIKESYIYFWRDNMIKDMSCENKGITLTMMRFFKILKSSSKQWSYFSRIFKGLELKISWDAFNSISFQSSAITPPNPNLQETHISFWVKFQNFLLQENLLTHGAFPSQVEKSTDSGKCQNMLWYWAGTIRATVHVLKASSLHASKSFHKYVGGNGNHSF